MAQPDIIRGTYFSLMLGNAGSPETFTALCGITTRNFTQQANTNDQFTRDCALPEDVPIRRLIVTGKQWSLSGDGVLNRANLSTIQAAWSVVRNWRYLFTEPANNLVYQGYYAGAAVMTNFQINSEDNNFAQISISLESDSAWAWTTV